MRIIVNRSPINAAVLIPVLLWCFLPSLLAALEVPPLNARVNDLAEILSSGAEAEMNRYLTALEETTGAQVAVLTLPSLEGESLEEYSIRVVDEWGLGNRERDDGALLLIAMEERKIRLEVGYGLEGTLTDIKSGFIIREVLTPHFKRGDFDQGVSAAVQAVGGVVSGNADISAETLQESRQSSTGGGIPFNFLVFLFILFIGGFGRRRRGSFGRALFWGALLGSSSRRSGSSRGGFSSGGGGFGGGGFSGGGGGFGGGGASGGW